MEDLGRLDSCLSRP